MKYRYLVIAIVAALILFGTPTVLAIATGDLSVSEEDNLNALLVYTKDSEEDSYTILAVSGAYDAYKKNPTINVILYPYPTNAGEEDLKKLLAEMEGHTKLKRGYDMVIVACPQNVIDPEMISKMYPEFTFVFIDSGYTPQKQLDNLRFYDFQGEQSAFLAGYVAGLETNTNIVGFVAGCESPSIDRLRYGFEAGVKYAAETRGVPIECRVSVIDTMTDEKTGKSAAIKLNQDGNGADIIMSAAGSANLGVISAAKELNIYAIGCDNDQSYLAPDNVLCSATKNLNGLIENILLTAADSKLSSNVISIANSLDSFIPLKLGLTDGYVNLEGLHSSITGLTEKINNLKSAIYKDVLPIPYSKETMKTWSVVPISGNQAPIFINDNPSGSES